MATNFSFGEEQASRRRSASLRSSTMRGGEPAILQVHDDAKPIARRADFSETLQSVLLGMSSLQHLSALTVLGADSVHVVFAGSQFYAAFVSERVTVVAAGAAWLLFASAALALIELAIVATMLYRKILSPSALQWLCIVVVAPAHICALACKHPIFSCIAALVAVLLRLWDEILRLRLLRAMEIANSRSELLMLTERLAAADARQRQLEDAVQFERRNADAAGALTAAADESAYTMQEALMVASVEMDRLIEGARRAFGHAAVAALLSGTAPYLGEAEVGASAGASRAASGAAGGAAAMPELPSEAAAAAAAAFTSGGVVLAAAAGGGGDGGAALPAAAAAAAARAMAAGALPGPRGSADRPAHALAPAAAPAGASGAGGGVHAAPAAAKPRSGTGASGGAGESSAAPVASSVAASTASSGSSRARAARMPAQRVVVNADGSVTF